MPTPTRIPQITFTNPPATISETTGNGITVRGTASDPDGIALVTVAISSNPTLSGDGTHATGTTEWSKTLALAIGDNTITATAHTTNGATAWADVTIVRVPALES
jgi:hypothetical protein